MTTKPLTMVCFLLLAGCAIDAPSPSMELDDAPSGKADGVTLDDGSLVPPSALELAAGFERNGEHYTRFRGEWFPGSVSGWQAWLVRDTAIASVETLFVLQPPAWNVDEARDVCAQLGEEYRLPRHHQSVYFEPLLFTSVDASSMVLEHVRARTDFNDDTLMAEILPAEFRQENGLWAEIDPYFLDVYGLQSIDGTDTFVSDSGAMSLAERIERWHLLEDTVINDWESLRFLEREAPRIAQLAHDNLAKLELGIPVVCVREGEWLR